MAGTEQELRSLKDRFDVKETQLRSERTARREAEVQLERLANSRISERLGQQGGLHRNSLETPVMSPDLWRN